MTNAEKTAGKLDYLLKLVELSKKSRFAIRT